MKVSQKKGMMLLLAMICIAFALVLTGCFGGGIDPQAHVQGNLDTIYLGQINDEYLNSLIDGTTKEQLLQDYEDGLESEAEFFANYFEVTTLSDQSKANLIEMYRDIYSHSKYEVGEAKDSESAYIVPVTIYPIDVIYNMVEKDYDAYVDDFNARADAGEFDDLTDEQYEDEWINGLIALINARMSDLGYRDSETVAVTVVEDDKGIYAISSDSFDDIDTYIIAYY